MKSRKPAKMLAEGRRLPVPATPVIDELKNPYVLEFLGLPEVAALQESDLERAIICTEKNEIVARYSVLNDRKRIFAAKYMLCLPTEEQLQRRSRKSAG
jgi:predicted nuclease of restriction endonuclease-like (RecB) superfamily